MKTFVLIVGAIYGLFSVILGAFGAHLFKKMLAADKLASFEVGVKYQMYHALLLLLIGFCASFQSSYIKYASLGIIVGTFLFSVSIYLLSFANYWNVNLKFLGPITPFGGLFMILGWLLLIFYFAKMPS